MKAGGFKKVSIQISGDAELIENENGETYFEAVVKDWIELSSVNAPGFKQTNIQQQLTEALKTKTLKEDVSDANNGADLTTDKIPEKEDNTEKDEFFEQLLNLRLSTDN